MCNNNKVLYNKNVPKTKRIRKLENKLNLLLYSKLKKIKAQSLNNIKIKQSYYNKLLTEDIEYIKGSDNVPIPITDNISSRGYPTYMLKLARIQREYKSHKQYLLHKLLILENIINNLEISRNNCPLEDQTGQDLMLKRYILLRIKMLSEFNKISNFSINQFHNIKQDMIYNVYRIEKSISNLVLKEKLDKVLELLKTMNIFLGVDWFALIQMIKDAEGDYKAKLKLDYSYLDDSEYLEKVRTLDFDKNDKNEKKIYKRFLKLNIDMLRDCGIKEMSLRKKIIKNFIPNIYKKQISNIKQLSIKQLNSLKQIIFLKCGVFEEKFISKKQSTLRKYVTYIEKIITKKQSKNQGVKKVFKSFKKLNNISNIQSHNKKKKKTIYK